MDRVTKSLLENFSNINHYVTYEEEKQFELFANYWCISSVFSESFDPEDTHTGGGQDLGIDGISIIINGINVTDPDQLDEIIATNGYIDATFIFVQAKRSSNFEGSEISNFCLGVKQFFEENPSMPFNSQIFSFREIAHKVYIDGSKFRHGNPSVKLFYVTTGTWNNDAQLTSRIEIERKDIFEPGLFRDVSITPIDALQLQKLYHASKNAVEREISFPNRIALPEIQGVSEAYLGIMPAHEFLNLVTDDNGKIIKSLFYDNVRDWQQFNDVNSEIQKTVNDPDQQSAFVLMNNGVTIVARRIQATGQKLFLKDYQIVNGCQTSHVLVESASKIISANTFIPIKIIATEDEAIKAAITQATNRQTQINPEQLHALSDFQKRLESFFRTFDENRNLYYERRSRQYNETEKIEKLRVISMTTLMRAYASAFLKEPHRATRDFKRITEGIGTKTFAANDKPEPYYLSAFLLYRTESYFRSGVLDKKLRPAKYHFILGALLEASNGVNIPLASTNEAVRFSNKLLTDFFWNDVNSQDIFIKVEAKLLSLAAGDYSPDKIRTQTYTQGLLKLYSAS